MRISSRFSLGLLAAACVACASIANAYPLPTGLVDTRGHVFDAAVLKSQWTLLTFGFTHCGATCPAVLAEAHRFLASVESMPGKPPAVQVVFVTLDPLSDDPSALRHYLKQFDTRLIDALTHSLHVGVTHESGVIEHSAEWYLISPELHVVAVYPAATMSGTKLALDVSRLVRSAT